MSNLADYKKKREENLDRIYSIFTKYLSFWRAYPDYFIDYILSPNEGKGKFRLFPFQRMMMRTYFRYRYNYYTLTRGTAKSFTFFLAQFIKAILYPGVLLGFAAPLKNQSYTIATQTLKALLKFLPILKRELDDKETKINTDETTLVFKNGSQITLTPLNENTRGIRTHGLYWEEIASKDMEDEKKQYARESVLIPTMSNSRQTEYYGLIDPNEITKSQAGVTTATEQDFYGFKIHQDFSQQLFEGGSAFVAGADYRLGAIFGNLDESFILEQKEMLPRSSFVREYMSRWGKSVDGRLASPKLIQELRKLAKCELSKQDLADNQFYVVVYDVAYSDGKDAADSAMGIMKFTINKSGRINEDLVNVNTFKGMGHIDQAKMLKETMRKYNAKYLVIDANSYGHAVVEDLMNPDLDNYRPYSVMNDERDEFYRFKARDADEVIFAISSQWPHTASHEITESFLLKLADKSFNLLKSTTDLIIDGEMSELTKEEKLAFYKTDYLEEQIKNLIGKRGSKGRIIVEQRKSSIPKDLYSMLEYGLFFSTYLEKQNVKKHRNDYNSQDVGGYRAPARRKRR